MSLRPPVVFRRLRSAPSNRCFSFFLTGVTRPHHLRRLSKRKTMAASPPPPSAATSHTLLNFLTHRRRKIRATLMIYRRPPEPPEPPDPPDTLSLSPPPTSILASRRFWSANPILTLTFPPMKSSSASEIIGTIPTGKAPPCLHLSSPHLRLLPSQTYRDLHGTRSHRSDCARRLVLSSPGSISFQSRLRDSVSQPRFRSFMGPPSSPSPSMRSQIEMAGKHLCTVRDAVMANPSFPGPDRFPTSCAPPPSSPSIHFPDSPPLLLPKSIKPKPFFHMGSIKMTWPNLPMLSSPFRPFT